MEEAYYIPADDDIDVAYDHARSDRGDDMDASMPDVFACPDEVDVEVEDDGDRMMMRAFGIPRGGGGRRQILRRGASRRSSGGESFAESLTGSFSGSGSFTDGGGGRPPSSLLDAAGAGSGGNLIFATDAEVATLMYGDEDDDDDANGGTIGGGTDESDREFINAAASSSKERCTGTVPMNLTSSLPPSATLGTGSFSTVRLAWRNRANDDMSSREDVVDTSPHSHSPPCQDIKIRGRRRRSIVRVHSKMNDVANDDENDDGAYDDDFSSERSKGELVAVKIIQKSILKQMKTMSRDTNSNRLTVHTAFDNIEREIATMKRLRHPNLVRLYEVIDSVESDCLLMVLEYVSLGE
jgi:hypothetical protein